MRERFNDLEAPELKEPVRKEVEKKTEKRIGGKEKKEKTAMKGTKTRRAKKAKTSEAK